MICSPKRKVLPVETTSHAFAYVFGGAGKFCNASQPLAVPTEPAGWADVKPPAEADSRALVLFLLVSGQPLGSGSPGTAGPIVMNTQEELRHAFARLQAGTFLQPDAPRQRP